MARPMFCSTPVASMFTYGTTFFMFTGTGESNLLEAEALLQPYLQKFPKVGFSGFFGHFIKYFAIIKNVIICHFFSRVPSFCFMMPE